MSSLSKQRYTPAQYLEMERKAEFRSEYRNGEIVPMQPSNRWRSRIITNLVALFSNQLGDGPEEVLAQAMRVKIAADGFCLYTYPDVVITGKHADFEDEHRDTLLNPLIVAEVFAPETAVVRMGYRRRDYRQLASHKEYLGVIADRPIIWHWQRLPKREWLLHTTEGLGKTVRLESIDYKLPLSQVYACVDFSLVSERPSEIGV